MHPLQGPPARRLHPHELAQNGVRGGRGAVMANPSAARKVREAMDRFPSGDQSIVVERFEPDAAGRVPAVVFLHGTDALDFMGDAYRGMARAFARQGYAIFLVHYFG